MFPPVPGHYKKHRATETVDKDLPTVNHAGPCKQPDHLTSPLPEQRPDHRSNHDHHLVTAEGVPIKQTSMPPGQDTLVCASDLKLQDNMSASRLPAAQAHTTVQAGDKAITQSHVYSDEQEQKGNNLLQSEKTADEDAGGQLVQQEQIQSAICIHASTKAIQTSEDCAGRQTATCKTEHLSRATQHAASPAQADPISPLPPASPLCISAILPLDPDGPKLADAHQAASAVDLQSEFMDPSIQRPNKAVEENMLPRGWHGWHGSRRGKRKAAPKPGIVSNTKASKLNHLQSASAHELKQLPCAVAPKMAQQLVELAATCRAAALPDAGKEQSGPNAAQFIKASGTSIQGRRVAFILLEDCRMMDAHNYLDVLSAGLQTGQ